MKVRLLLILQIFLLSSFVLAAAPKPKIISARKGNKKNDITAEPNQTYWKELCNLTPSQLNLTSPVVSFNATLIILIPLLPKDLELRDVIRTYYRQGNYSKSMQEGSMAFIFLMAESSPSKNLIEEAKLNKDILIVPGVETYKRLVYKILLGFRWVNFYYPKADLAKVDSDVVLLADNLYNAVIGEKTDLSVTGRIVEDPVIIRDPTHRWYVSKDLLSGYYYPTYVNGPTYFFKSSALMKILIAANKVPVIEVEDAYFTGVLTRASGVKVIHNEQIFLERPTWSVDCDYNTKKFFFIAYQVDKETETVKQSYDTLEEIKCRRGTHLGIIYKLWHLDIF